MSKKDKFLIREALEEIDLDAISQEYEDPEKMKKRKFLKKSIEELLEKDFNIEGNYIINKDSTVSVDGNVEWKSNKLKLSVTFSEVTGKFDCSSSNLESLEGSPKKVIHFDCYNNKNLTSLEGGPEEAEYYYCYYCNLLSVKGAPKRVGYFNCEYNKKLTSLEGGPEEAEEYHCYDCNLLSLRGAPKKVKEFDFSDNPIHDKLKKEGKL